MQWQLVRLEEGDDTSDPEVLEAKALKTFRSMADAQTAAHKDAGVRQMEWDYHPDDPDHSLRATPGGGTIYLLREV